MSLSIVVQGLLVRIRLLPFDQQSCKNRTEQNRAKQNRAKQNRTEQNNGVISYSREMRHNELHSGHDTILIMLTQKQSVDSIDLASQQYNNNLTNYSSTEDDKSISSSSSSFDTYIHTYRTRPADRPTAQPTNFRSTKAAAASPPQPSTTKTRWLRRQLFVQFLLFVWRQQSAVPS